MDPQIGTLTNGDVLIEDDRILAIAPGLPDDDAEVVDVSGHIVAPGMIDTHRHTWQTQLRGLCADWTLTDYVFGVRLTLSPAYRPEDVYLGNRTGALDALNAGVTTLLDFSHCNNTPEHADAAVTGLRDSGIRAVFGYGFFESSPFAPPHFAAHADRLADFARIADASFTSKDNLITLGVALTEPELVPLAVTRDEVLAAREREALIVTHTGCLWQFPTAITAMDDAGLLGPDQVHVHCNTLTDGEWRRLARNDAKLSISPETELNMGMGRPAFTAAARHGIKPTLSCDVLSLNTGDLFTQLRLGVAFQRWADTEPVNLAGGDPEAVTVAAHDALNWTTVNAAEAVGLGDRIGSLTPGKQADVLVVANPANSHPQIDPAGTLLFQTTADSVRHVLVAGRFVKRDGKLVGVDVNQLNAEAEASARQILTGIADSGRQLPGTLPGGLAIIKELVD
ncbi:MAG: 5-methylthioadenosine/S-adenosylhomocysteine deaminase [Mycobacterium sp.]|jgi:cytosine/adenosine deaminase-related metal-dependent hydrolase|nr:5-methylthioadenosine/S-adenosylhomocysteine deaminase [Mycobacterium sp.]